MPNSSPTAHLALQLVVDDRILLLRVRQAAAIDPGHWTLPWGSIADGVGPPSASFCGIPTDIAFSAQQVLATSLDDATLARQILNRSEQAHLIGAVDVPAWSPAHGRMHILQVRLPTRPELGARASWACAQDWLAAWRKGNCLLNPLALTLMQHQAEAQALEWPAIEAPMFDLRVLHLASRTLPPATHTNAFLLGDDPKILVDPSPADADGQRQAEQLIRETGIDALFLTHHHPDHHESAPDLARQFSLPLWGSADTRARLVQRWGRNYLAGVSWRDIDDGEVIAQTLGENLRALAVPGHDAGQLALAPDSLRWMIVGDLIQGIGTVVIAHPEGDMATYLETLRRVIAMAPQVIMPSHGQAMASTYRLEQTLAHRLEREAQVLALRREGLQLEDMVARIYADADRRVWPLGRITIESHLKKLRDEGRLPE